MWTAGNLAIRQETSLRFRASRTSVFKPRAPTPSARTKVAGTTFTSCPHSSAASATENASAQLSTTTRLFGLRAKYFFNEPVGHLSSASTVPSQ
jgi:hypothetical protein